ncbi:3'-5' exonuclease [Alkalicoccus saliphilus]|nr:3'-5' exonuclease [Alkalicoccus saliphilus]
MMRQVYTYIKHDRPRFRHFQKEWINEHRDEWHLAREAVKQANTSAYPFEPDVEKAEFTVFDLETTGFSMHMGDEILSVGGVHFKKNQTDAEDFYSVVRSSKPIPPVVTKLTGLTDTDTREGEAFPSVLIKFLRFTHGRILSAHPASFDVPFLEAMCRRWNLPLLKMPVLDTAKLAALLYPGQDTSLEALLSRFQLAERQGHHALTDAKITAEVLQHLLEKAAEENYWSLPSLIKDTHRVAGKRRRI